MEKSDKIQQVLSTYQVGQVLGTFAETEGAGLVKPSEEEAKGNLIAVYNYLSGVTETMEPNTSG